MTDYDELRRLAAEFPDDDEHDERVCVRHSAAEIRDRHMRINAFIAAARTAIPELLDALEAARKDVEVRKDMGKQLADIIEHRTRQLSQRCGEIEDLRSIIADLRRQLAGLGIPTGETK